MICIFKVIHYCYLSIYELCKYVYWKIWAWCVEKNMKNKKVILKSQENFRIEKHNVFTEEVNKFALNPNNDKRIQSIDSIETNTYGTRGDLVCYKEEIKCNNIIKQYKNDYFSWCYNNKT